jgi:ubiquinone/menaquinone biosynthesis C-methylase UbiE
VNVEELVLLFADEYSRMAETYDARVAPRFAAMAKHVLALADPRPGELVLDLGCGTGNLALQAAPRVAAETGGVVAIDLAHDAVNLATTKAARKGIRNVRFEMMDGRNIVYRGRIFDAVLSCFGVPVFGYDRSFAEVRRVLKDGGRFVFCEWSAEDDPIAEAFTEVLARHAAVDPPADVKRLREAALYVRESEAWADLRRPEVLTRKLKDAGFAEVRVTTERHPVVFPAADDYLAFRGAWGYVDRELAAMDDAARAAFRRTFAAKVAPHATAEGLVVPWEVHYYHAEE